MIALATTDVTLDVVYLVDGLEGGPADLLGLLDWFGPVDVVAGTGADNAASIALLQRVGMRTFANPYGGWPGVIGVLENPSP